MTVNEVFPSIQGESTSQGLPTVFIRLAGCNLDCVWCDTGYARTEGTERTIPSILDEVESYYIRTVCITGGEPLLQNDTPALAHKLADRGFAVSIETNGSIDASSLDERIRRIIDIKCPGSGEHESIYLENLERPRVGDEFKCVLSDRADFDYAVEICRSYGLDDTSTVLFSPVCGALALDTLAEWILEDAPFARLHFQLHKLVWPDSSRGK